MRRVGLHIGLDRRCQTRRDQSNERDGGDEDSNGTRERWNHTNRREQSPMTETSGSQQAEVRRQSNGWPREPIHSWDGWRRVWILLHLMSSILYQSILPRLVLNNHNRTPFDRCSVCMYVAIVMIVGVRMLKFGGLAC